jgi:DNA-binding MarR family transcriptional regulator
MNASHNPPDNTIDMTNHLYRSALRLLRVLQATQPAKGLTLSRLSVLGRLYRDGMATATALADYLHIQPQSLTRLIADLERRKLITRRPNGADRRQSLLAITDAGVHLLIETVHDQQAKLAQTMAKELTPAEQELLRIAAGLMDHLATVIEAQTDILGELGSNGSPAEALG